MSYVDPNTRRVLEDIVIGELDWTRLALTSEQIERYDLTVIIKKDKRLGKQRPQPRVLTRGPALKPGEHEAVETEALFVRDWLDGLLPTPLDRVHAREQRERDRLRKLVEGSVSKSRK
jgi:hypothetical protein